MQWEISLNLYLNPKYRHLRTNPSTETLLPEYYQSTANTEFLNIMLVIFVSTDQTYNLSAFARRATK